MTKHSLINIKTATLALIAALIITRLLTLGLYPLYDTTEARYGEMARIMLETGNWITPQFDYNVPFWGKPPMQTWLSALSFFIFGINEFAARLPHFLCGMLTLWLTYRFAREQASKSHAVYASLILTSSLGFIIASGMVMTDAALLMATTLAMVSFWHNYQQQSRLDGHLFFVALALGLLIKGPVAVVLIGIALVTWSLWQRCFINAITSLPWLTGIPLMLLIALPWYIAAEISSPGFLEYFIVGEHIQRFLVSGWQGDLYGTAHVETKGTIWLFWLATAFPWSFVLLALVFRRQLPIKQIQAKAPLNKFLICWMLAPMLLFTMAGNILPAYVLPGFAAMAVLIAINSQLTKRSLIYSVMTLVILVTVVVVFSFDLSKKDSEVNLLSNKLNNTAPLYYWKKRPFSAQFYSQGKAKLIEDSTQLTELLQQSQPILLAISHSDYEKIALDLIDCQSINRSTSRVLLRCH